MPASAAGTRRWTGLRGITFAISLAIAAVIASSAGYASAEPFEYGRDYTKSFLGYNEDGRAVYSWQSNPERIFDGSQYQDRIVTQNPNWIKYETMHGSVILSKTYCSFAFYRAGTIQDAQDYLFADSIVPKVTINGTNSWASIPAIDSAACTISLDGSTLELRKYAASVGEVRYRYVDLGHKWKTELEATNLSSWSNRQFGFTQSINLNNDHVRFANATRNLQNFNNTVFDRSWLEQNQSNVLDFLNGASFDFDLGFDSLERVTTNAYSNGTARLSFDYYHDAPLILPGQTVLIDPSFGYSSGTRVNPMTETGPPTCNTAAVYNHTTPYGLVRTAATSAGRCWVMGAYWNITSIPDTSIISSVSANLTVTGVSNPKNCDITSIEGNLSTETFAQQYADITNGTSFVSNSSFCTSNGITGIISLGNATSDLQAELATDNEWGAGVKFYLMTHTGTQDEATITDFQLYVVYFEDVPPEAIFDLTASNIQGDSLDLSWTEPDLQGNDLIGYRLNYTTPCGDPTTILVNDTGTSTTEYTVSGLSETTCYSFRVTAITVGGKNATGNIENATTTIIFPNFTIGDINVNATNPSITPIRFERTDDNSTMTTLKVIYDNTYDMACQFSYTFEQDSDTYMNLTEEVYDADHNSTDFIFLDPSNDIINARCWDQATNDTGRYVLAFSQFPLLDQIDNFRNGTYGTMGMFGALDFITVAVIIFSMIGFNRVNEAAGAFFNVSLLAALAYFGIIELPTIIFGGIAVIVMFAIASTRKD